MIVISDPIEETCEIPCDKVVCDLYVQNIPIKVNKNNTFGDLSCILSFIVAL